MATARINLTVDETAKTEALKLFEQFGVDASTAVNMFFKKVVQTKSIPFEISLNDTNGQYFRWYCNSPQKLTSGTYTKEFQVGDKTLYVTFKVIKPPTNDGSTTVVF